MPTYQYACTECDHAFEQFQSFTDDALTTCPECQGRLRKVYNAVGVVFKGSGFYRTDSRGDQKAKNGSAESNGSGGTSSSDGAGSSSDKPATSTTSKDSTSTSSSGGKATSAA